MRIVALTHVPFEGPAAIGDWAAERGHDLAICPVYRDTCFPAPEQYDMLVIMGGPMSIFDDADHPWLARERRFVRSAILDDKLVVGVCLGAQFIAHALGAEVYKNTEPEIGWFPVRRVAEGITFAGVPDPFMALHWHGQTFDLPADATLLASTDVTPHQAFEWGGGRVLALQLHLEATPESVAALAGACADELTELPHVQTAAELAAGAARESAGTRELLFAALDRVAASALVEA